jgi:hypothetical protein
MVKSRNPIGNRPSNGRDLQRLIHAIESSLHAAAQVRVESPKRLVDKDTGRLREHDVVLTFLESPHELLVALECRDRSRPVGVPEVEAFWAKCQRTGINHGIIVSSRGFTKSAILKANTQNVGCLFLDEVENFDWCQTPGVTVLSHDLVALKVRINFQTDPGEGRMLILADGSPVNEQVMRNWALHIFNTQLAGQTDLSGVHALHFVEYSPAIFIEHPAGRMQATELFFSPTYKISRTPVPFEFRTYFDQARPRTITAVAIAQVEVGQNKASMVLSRDTNSGKVRITIVPIPSASTAKPKNPAAQPDGCGGAAD